MINNNTSFTGKLIPLKQYKGPIMNLSSAEKKEIQQLKDKISIISQETDSLYKYASDGFGEMTPENRQIVLKNDKEIKKCQEAIDTVKQLSLMKQKYYI